MSNRERETGGGMLRGGKRKGGESKSQRILKNTRSNRGLEICKYYKNKFFLDYYIITIAITHHLVIAFNMHTVKQKICIQNVGSKES